MKRKPKEIELGVTLKEWEHWKRQRLPVDQVIKRLEARGLSRELYEVLSYDITFWLGTQN